MKTFIMNGLRYYSRNTLVPLHGDPADLMRVQNPEMFTDPERVRSRMTRFREWLQSREVHRSVKREIRKQYRILLQHKKNLKELGLWSQKPAVIRSLPDERRAVA